MTETNEAVYHFSTVTVATTIVKTLATKYRVKKKEMKVEKKFFHIFLGFSPHENEHVNRTFKSDEINNFTTVDKILLKCDGSTRSKAKGSRKPEKIFKTKKNNSKL